MTAEQLDLSTTDWIGYRDAYSVAGSRLARVARLRSRETVSELSNLSDSSDPFSAWWQSYVRAKDKSELGNAGEALGVVDLFSSVGGLSLGFGEAARALGWRVNHLLAVDVDQEALRVYRSNHKPRAVVNGSVRDLVDFRIAGAGRDATFATAPRSASEQVDRLSGRVDVILAGPPCQGHSTFNNHSRGDDPRNLLYLSVPAFALATDAKVVVIENVPNVVRDKYGVVQSSIALLKSNGYHVTSAVLAAHRLGWAQTRRRFFLVATKSESPPLDLALLAKSMERAALPLSAVIGDLVDLALDESDVMHSVPVSSAENRKRIDWLFENDAHNLPDEIRPDCHKDGHTYDAVYGRMHWDRPAQTITGGFLSPGRGRFIHPLHPRVITPHEAARIQGFPDFFRFQAAGAEPPTRASISKWIGDAVPTILGYTAGVAALSGFVAE